MNYACTPFFTSGGASVKEGSDSRVRKIRLPTPAARQSQIDEPSSTMATIINTVVMVIVVVRSG